METPSGVQGKVVTDFFISYTQVDRSWAEWIAWQLEEAGYTTVIQAWDFRPGRNFVVDMQYAAAGSERTIAALSPSYLESCLQVRLYGGSGPRPLRGIPVARRGCYCPCAFTTVRHRGCCRRSSILT